MSILDILLRFAGMTSDKIAEVDADLPHVAALARTLKPLEPILQKMKPHAEALEPLIAEAWPILVKAAPDAVASLPAAEDLVELAENEKS